MSQQAISRGDSSNAKARTLQLFVPIKDVWYRKVEIVMVE